MHVHGIDRVAVARGSCNQVWKQEWEIIMPAEKVAIVIPALNEEAVYYMLYTTLRYAGTRRFYV
jgi:hypothetical protein